MVKILTIDGGGIRGIIPAVILAYIEKELQRKTGRWNVALADYFDLIAGTSTGGILACFYLLPPYSGSDSNEGHSRYPASKAVELYTEHGRDIFTPKITKPVWGISNLFSEKYSDEGLNKVLASVMGDVRLSETRKNALVTAYDITNRKAVLFSTVQAKRYLLRDYYLRDIARATSAAPTYFKLATIRSIGGAAEYLIDGAMFAADPTLCALVEANKSVFEGQCNPGITDMYIVSIGTGKELKKYDYRKARTWGIIRWAVPVLNILMSASSEVGSYQVAQLFSVAGCEKNYVRIEPGLNKAAPDMDDASERNIDKLRDAGLYYIAENAEQLDAVVDKLMELRVVKSEELRTKS
jgi:patatin-like phospholipase/acyl hydrolase